MKDETTIGGLRCADVLELLARFLDGSLDDETRRAVIAHLGGCERCERFGAMYSALVKKIRTMARSDEPDPAVLSRLRTRLAAR
jgi:anti-sigma factor RsiW